MDPSRDLPARAHYDDVGMSLTIGRPGRRVARLNASRRLGREPARAGA
jgi:hypothetical protein